MAEIIPNIKAAASTLMAFALATMLLGCGRLASERETDFVAGSDMTTIETRQRKIFTNWTPANVPAGACQSRNGRLILYSDGSQEWEIELLSASGGTRWEQAFHFYDTEKPDHTWFGSRSAAGVDINYRNVWMYSRHRRGPGDLKLAAAFDRIRYVVWSAGC
jgi:hypothetical protein